MQPSPRPVSSATHANNVCSGAQPDHNKSLGQEASDKASRSHDRTAHGSSGGSVLDKTKNALGLDKH
jgi:hypothetical protein